MSATTNGAARMSMPPISRPMTEDWRRSVVADRHLSFWPLRECSICDTPIGYRFSPDGTRLGFDPTCGCPSYGGGGEEREWRELAESFNRQNDEWFEKMVTSFLRDGETYLPVTTP